MSLYVEVTFKLTQRQIEVLAARLEPEYKESLHATGLEGAVRQRALKRLRDALADAHQRAEAHTKVPRRPNEPTSLSEEWDDWDDWDDWDKY